MLCGWCVFFAPLQASVPSSHTIKALQIDANTSVHQAKCERGKCRAVMHKKKTYHVFAVDGSGERRARLMRVGNGMSGA